MLYLYQILNRIRAKQVQHFIYPSVLMSGPDPECQIRNKKKSVLVASCFSSFHRWWSTTTTAATTSILKTKNCSKKQFEREWGRGLNNVLCHAGFFSFFPSLSFRIFIIRHTFYVNVTKTGSLLFSCVCCCCRLCRFDRRNYVGGFRYLGYGWSKIRYLEDHGRRHAHRNNEVQAKGSRRTGWTWWRSGKRSKNDDF